MRVVEKFEACSDGLNPDFQTRDSNKYCVWICRPNFGQGICTTTSFHNSEYIQPTAGFLFPLHVTSLSSVRLLFVLKKTKSTACVGMFGRYLAAKREESKVLNTCPRAGEYSAL